MSVSRLTAPLVGLTQAVSSLATTQVAGDDDNLALKPHVIPSQDSSPLRH